MSRLKLAAVAAGVIAIVSAASAAAAVPSMLNLGPAAKGTAKTYAGYYDGHKDTYVVTDVSSKSQASAMNINYSPPLAKVKGAPSQYFIQGKAAAGQIAVFGSEPGESRLQPALGRADRHLEGRASSLCCSSRTTRSTASRRRASSPSRTRTSS